VNERSRLAFAIEVFQRVLFSLRSSSSRLALGLSEQLRQPRDIDGDPPCFVFRQHLGLQRSGFAVSGIDVRDRLTVGVADDVAACDLCRRARARGSGGPSLWVPRWYSLSNDRGAASESNVALRVLPHRFVHQVQRALHVIRFADHG
jgi:hypothetical protein